MELATTAFDYQQPAISTTEITIRPTHGWRSIGLHEIWEYRELLYFLLMRDVKGRYRQMAFGPLWIIIQPLINMVIFSLLFGSLANLPSEGVPYPLFTYVALLPWQFFATGSRTASQSLLNEKSVIAKVYFPRLIIPMSTVLAALVDFFASFAILIGMLIFYHVRPGWQVLTLPFFLLLAAATALSVGLWLAGLAVKYHDVAIGLGFAITVWQYVSPVAYSANLIPQRWQNLYNLNPLAAVINGFRWALLGVSPAPDWTTLVSSLLVACLLVTGAFYFRASERTIVDEL